MRRAVPMALVSLGLTGPVTAGDVAVPLLTSNDIQISARPSVFQGVEHNNSGAIYFPDSILSFAVNNADGDGQKIIDQWSKSHYFVIIPINISVAPQGDLTPESVDVAASLPAIGQLKQQLIVIDSFPATGFSPGAFQGEASLKLNTEAKLAPVPTGGLGSVGAGIEGSAGLNYKYAPAYANVVSGFASGHAFWQFRRTQDKYPVGEIPMKLLVAVPRDYKKKSVVVNFDVKVRFSGAWWKGGVTVASFASSVALPGVE